MIYLHGLHTVTKNKTRKKLKKLCKVGEEYYASINFTDRTLCLTGEEPETSIVFSKKPLKMKMQNYHCFPKSNWYVD